MRTRRIVVVGIVVTSLGCRGKPKDIGPTREVHANGLVVRVGGPLELEASDSVYTGFMTVENRSSKPVYASIEGCGIDLEPGERRGCYSYKRMEEEKHAPIAEMNPVRRLPLKLTEMSLERTTLGHARFSAFILNDGRERRVGSIVRFDVVDEDNRLVGAATGSPAKSKLAPGESSKVDLDVRLAKGSKGKLTAYAPVASGAPAERPESTVSATLTDLSLQASTKQKQVAALITNVSAVPIRPSVWFYLKDKKNRAIASAMCTDTVRDVAPVPLAPNESTPCTAPWQGDLPRYDRVEVEATPASAMWGQPVTLTPLELGEVKVEGGFIHVAVKSPAPKMAFYIRAKPDWLHIDYANDKSPYAYRLDGATAAEVKAFAVGGPPGEGWIPIRQFGKSD